MVTLPFPLGLGIEISQDGRRRSGFELLGYRNVSIGSLVRLFPQLGDIGAEIARQIEIDAGYAVYLERQEADIQAIKRDEALEFPPDFDYDSLAGLSNEMKSKLNNVRPFDLGQASRIEGMTPAALTLLLAHIKSDHKKRTGSHG